MDSVISGAKWSMSLGDRILMFHGEKNTTGAMHADQAILRELLRAARKLGVKMVRGPCVLALSSSVSLAAVS